MNKKRRQRIAVVLGAIQQQIESLEVIRDEEQDAFDNLPESLQDADLGQSMQEALDGLEEAISSATDVADHLAGLTE